MDREDAREKPRNPLSPLVEAWEGVLKRASEYKQKNFDVYAEEAVEFYLGPKDMDDFYSKRMLTKKNGAGELSNLNSGFRTVSAKVAELVQIFGPSLYARNPVRTVNPRKVSDIPRETFIPRSLERQVQKQVEEIQKQAQQYMQQIQQQAGPQQPGQPPNPQLQQYMQQVQQQVQQQIEQAQAPLRQAEDVYNQLLDWKMGVESDRRLKALLLDSYLNYTPNELDLKTESRLGINEALIKGAGALWTELKDHGGLEVVGSFFDSIDNLILDPDVESLSDMRWIARRCVKTVQEVSDRYGVEASDLRPYAKLHSYTGSGADKDTGDGGPNSEVEMPKDLITYYEIYSKIGFGHAIPSLQDDIEDELEALGKYVYLAIVPGMKSPLNFDETMFSAKAEKGQADQDEESDDGESDEPSANDELTLRASWPIPFWMDGSWPVEILWFHEVPNCVWPMSHVRPAMPQLKAITWNMNHLANRARNSSRFIVGVEYADDDDTSSMIKSGDPVTVIRLRKSQNEKIADKMSVLEIPQGGAQELMQVQGALIDEFQKSTGLSEVMYAQPGGMRSAAEAQMKQSSMNIRPDDMAAQVEDWQSRLAAKEAMAAVWLLTAEDVAPVIGDQISQMWDQVFGSADPAAIALELDVRIEAGSTRKPNKETRVQQMNQAFQTIGQVLAQVAMTTGQVGPYNELTREWGKANDILDIEKFMIQPPPPPQPPQPDPNIQAKAQAETQKTQQEGQMKMAIGQQQMQAGQQKMQIEAQKAQMELAAKAAELQLDQQKAQMDLQKAQMQAEIDIAKAQASMQATDREHNQKMIAEAQKSNLNLAIQERKAEQQERQAEKQNAIKSQQMRRQGQSQGRSKRRKG